MSQYQRILVVVNPAMQRTPAVQRAIHIARETGAEIDLCLFDHHAGIEAVGLVQPEVMKLARTAFVAEREDWLGEATANLRSLGIRANGEFIWGTPIEDQIVARVVQGGYDLVIKDVGLDPHSRKLRMTPLDRHVLRLCPAPLLLVQSAQAGKLKRIVAAVDPAEDHDSTGTLNTRVVRAALALAIQCDAKLHLAYAFAGLPPEAMSMTWSSSVMFNDAYQTLRGIRRSEFESFARENGVPVECRHFLHGEPAAAIPDLAADGEADVVVVGAMFRTRLNRLMLGSNAERILEAVRCDVLVVKPEGFLDELARHFDQPTWRAAPDRTTQLASAAR